MGFGAEMEMKLYLGEDDGDLGDIQEHSSGGIVVETLVNIRTVSSLTIEDMRSSEFSKALHEEDPTPIKSNFIKGCATGLGQFIQQWGVALMFWWYVPFIFFAVLFYPLSDCVYCLDERSIGEDFCCYTIRNHFLTGTF